eukprot:TRINITY_DN3624_c0_g2_i1.p1 TRINITY_DN3624_c0_g2~~TRINITY_DN3624_c0_g2_i1.p1  ORF type:complete len:199 (+),score=55.09 TRINITY_DN3624_c0_g2_i1:35-631(+)
MRMKKKKKQCGAMVLTRDVVCEVVDGYGVAWKRQDEDRIAALFTEDGEYVERIGTKVGTFVGRDEIKGYWRRQIESKQSDISFEHIVDDMILNSAEASAVVKWVASFTNQQTHTAARDLGAVTFTQIAILHFREVEGAWLVSRLEEYWHSPTTDRNAKGHVYPPSKKIRNRSKNLHANLARVKATNKQVPSLAEYVMQ